MIALLKLLLSTVADDTGALSCTRVVMLVGSMLVITTACGAYALAAWRGTTMPEVPLSTSTFILTILGSLFTTKMVQTAQENKTPVPPAL